MKTEKPKHQKSHYDIRYFLILVTIIICPILIQAQYLIQPTDDHDIIKDISYDYELTESIYQGRQCYGTLYLSIDISDDIERLFLERTSPHYPEDSPPKFLLKRELPLDDLIALQDYPWQIKFRIWIHYKDGTKKYSDIYNINDFINEEDLKLLYESSSTEILLDESMDLTLNNRIIHLKGSEKGCLYVFESSGKIIYSKIIDKTESFDIQDLNVSNDSTIIIRFQSTNKTITKKYQIQ